jgi:VCBS repeat protein
MQRRNPAAISGLRIFTLAALLTVLGAVGASAQSSTLKARRDFAVGDHPVGVLAVDFDADGVLDLITTDQLSSSLSLVKGFGDGTFRRLSGVVTGTYPSDTIVADVNNDGKPDLVSSNLLTRDVTVNLGNGLGGFGAKISSGMGGNAGDLAVGDWNRDGKLDVAVVSPQQNALSIALGDGTGHFGAPRLVTVGAYPKQIVAADFDGDTKLDLGIVCRDLNRVQVWIGDGTGLFALSSTLSVTTGASPSNMAAADLSGDGKVDIAVGGNTGSASFLQVFIQGASGFGAPTSYNSVGFGPQGIAVGDINSDGKPDLVVALADVSGTGSLATLLGTTGGAFGPPTTVNTGNGPKMVALGDFNKDGNLDAVSVNNGGNNVSILQNIGAGAFLVAGKINLPSGSFPDALAAADFNHDQKPDVAIAYEQTNLVTVANGDCQGGFAILNSANNVGITPITMVAADFDGDQDTDLVVGNNFDNSFSYLANGGLGNFTVTNGLSAGAACDSLVASASGQISADAFPDVAFACEGVGYVCTVRGTGLGGASAFGPAVCTQLGGTSEGVAVARYNLDNLQDIAVTARDLGEVQIGISDGNGGITDIPATFPVNSLPVGIVSADINGDLIADLVIANSGSGTVSALLGDGGGGFTFPSIDSPAGQAPTALVVQDINMDGKQDVVVVNTNGNDVSLLLGDGAGHFSNAGNFGVRDQPLAIAAGDFNCDLKPDVAVADNFTDTVTILLNQSVAGDPLQTVAILGGNRLVFQWGVVPGAVYDVIRGQVKQVIQGSSSIDLGAVTCLANDLAVNDTADFPDSTTPPLGDAFFYTVRAIVNGVPGPYTVSAPGGKIGSPSSGSCP